jgi:hypothetical protein
MCSRARPLILAQHGGTAYQIVISESASASDSLAAAELQRYLERISGVRIPVRTDTIPAAPAEILIGRNTHLDSLGFSIPFSRLQEDGFVLKTRDRALAIAGGTEKGSLYGVYSLLEECLDCRMYAPGAEIVPARATLSIPPLDETRIPVIRHRELYYHDAYDSTFLMWHKLDAGARGRTDWGMWVHTFKTLVPPGRYFKDHPEFFSMVGGQRVPDGQLCLSNPDVLEVLCSNLEERMRLRPDALYWSVSQNDTYSPCECPACSTLNAREGSPAGSLIHFINRVAERFPDKIISTLAYQYTRPAPRRIRPAKNVNIVLCTIELNRSRPIGTDALSQGFRRDMENWSRICDNLMVWDYVVQFRNLVSPFPNLRVLQPNIRYFVKNNVRMMFQQGNGSPGGEFSHLRAYIIAKLLWNPGADVEKILDDFLHGYYGPAAPHLHRYIDMMHNAMERSGGELGIYGSPYDAAETYLAPRLLDRYMRLFDEAEKAAESRPVHLARVNAARLPLMYARLELARRYGTGPKGLFARTENGSWRTRPEMRDLLDRFVRGCRDAGNRFVEEHGTTPENYKASLERLFAVSMQDHLALFKPVRLTVPASPKYPAGGPAALTNGLRGLEDYHCHWLGYEGENMEAVIDLGTVKTVRSIKASFLQTIIAWVWLPVRVEYAVSEDGTGFRTVSVLDNPVSGRRADDFIHSFGSGFDPVKARYIRVRAENRKICPDWHKGHGGPAWIFCDEVVVQ